MTEQEYHFEGDEKKAGFGTFLWNSQTKEFLGRSGSSWAKVSFFYSIFYACLGAFFIGMLSVFFQVMPLDKPTYYGEESTMAQKGLNPGLGFRPQIDVEDNLISYRPSSMEGDDGFKKYSDNLRIFLEAKYSEQDSSEVVECEGDDNKADLKAGKSCKYNYKEIFASTNCTEENNFGYNTNSPCVLIKLNKIVSWNPAGDDGVKILCHGATSVDKDNLKAVTYHSEGHLNAKEGHLSAKYFPFYSQNSYRAPFVFVQFDLQPNVLVNVRCKAYADNIDNDDDTNQRGSTKFALFTQNN